MEADLNLNQNKAVQAPNQQFPARFDQVCAVIDKFGRDPHKLIPILQEIQKEYAYLPKEVMTYVATALGISPGAVYGVATFYSHFTLKPKGKHVVKVCDGTACHVKKSGEIKKTLIEELGLKPGQTTTEDMLFTLETVACLGACGLAPVVVVDDAVHGEMTPDKVRALLQSIREGEDTDAAAESA